MKTPSGHAWTISPAGHRQSKGAVLALTRSLAVQFAGHGACRESSLHAVLVPLAPCPKPRYAAAMRIRLVVSVLMVALLAACGSGGGATPTAKQGATSQPAAATPAGNGKVDCARIKTAAQQLLMVQFLAQLKTADTIEAVKSKQMGNLDPDVFVAAMGDLHALDAYTSPLGDPKAAIDFYEKAGKAAKVLFATEPMTQAAIDAYNQNVGTIPDFLGHQVAIAGAMDAAGC